MTKFSLRKLPVWQWMIPLSALFIKFITIANIPGHIWLGADGESYLDGVNGLVQSGLFSNAEKLQYFPAGYPILIWLLSKISISNALLFLSIFQSIVFAIASALFVNVIFKTRFAKFAPWLLFLLNFNPTLSLSSLALGYESLVSSLLMLSFAVLWIAKNDYSRKFEAIIVSTLLGSFAAFLQPRYLATTLIVLATWCFLEYKKSTAIRIVAIGLIVVFIMPMGLGLRNLQAADRFFISNNLGVTMNVGAGPESTGGYTNKATGVTCPPEVKTDNQKVFCILKWYLTNPTQTIRLSFNKTVYFFSPWSGPLANGTMARNPWLKVNPVTQSAKTPEGFKTIYGGFGKAISWLWLIGQVALLIWGSYWLWRQGAELRRLAVISGTTVGVSWLVALGTIGDHRFRMPVMAFMFILQLAGIRGLSRKPLVLKPKSKKR